MTKKKLTWSGLLTAVQPRIRLMRSFDERSHSYLGYILRVQGTVADQDREFEVAIGPGAHAKHQFRSGDEVEGAGVPVADPRLETAELYKVSQLRVLERSERPAGEPPPWLGVPPALDIYRQRGHRRLAVRTYASRCSSCIWGCKMAVEMIVDQWNPSQKKFRTETFCYGPLSCRFYRAGATRKVPGRRGMTWEEEDWIDEEATAHRDPDE